MFATSNRDQGLDLDTLIQTFGPQGGFTAPRTGMFGGKPTQQFSPNPGAAPPAVAAMRADREPLNMGVAPPDNLMGTQPIGMQALAQQIPNDPRIAQATRPGMFGRGGRGWQIMGIVGDALATAGGGRATYMPAILAQQEREREEAIWEKRFGMQAALKAQPSPSTAARIAVEAGLKPGTLAYQQFIRRYAFTPRLMTVGNAQGGEDQVEYDPSGLGAGAQGGPQEVTLSNGQKGYWINGELYDNPEGR